jgi:hypothetical protein
VHLAVQYSTTEKLPIAGLNQFVTPKVPGALCLF